MAENVVSDSSEIGSITSSQKSYLTNCPFAGNESLSTQSDETEVLVSPAVVKTPILSQTSLDSINDEVFRTPPENASLSSAPDSEPTVKVSEIKLRGGGSPSSIAETTLLSSSSSPSENIRVLEMNRTPDSALRSSTAKTTPLSSSPSPNVRVLEMNHTPDSVPRSSLRVPTKHFDSNVPSEIANVRTMNQTVSDSVNNNGALKSLDRVLNLASASATERTKVSETESYGEIMPFKEIIEALLRNSGENLDERDANVSCVQILKQCGFKFP